MATRNISGRNIASSFSCCTMESFLETVFYKFGRKVGTHPWITILIALIIAGSCSVGLLKFHEETKSTRLWVPYGLPALRHDAFSRENYPSKIGSGEYLVKAQNVLRPGVLKKMLELHERVKATTVEDANSVTVEWESICYRVGQECVTTSLLELWSFDTTLINALTEDDILAKVNEDNLMSPVFFSPVNIESLLGGISRDADGKISSAKVTLMTFTIGEQEVADSEPKYHFHSARTAWELAFTELADLLTDQSCEIRRFSSRRLVMESSNTINNDLTLLVMGYALIVVYIIIAMSKLTIIEHKIYIAIAGMLTVGLSIISAVGLASAVGQSYGPLHSILPFLLLGIGVDDMFVIVTSWYNLTAEERKLDVEVQVAKALKHSGVSITVTSFTDFGAFLIGGTTILPALRSFCIYCGIGIIFLFIFSISFFLAFLVIDQRRYTSHRDACCCLPLSHDYVPSEFGQRSFLQEFFYKYYSPFLLNIPAKTTVLVSTFTLLGVCTWSTLTWEQNFDFRWLLPQHGHIRPFLDASEEYFPSSGFSVAMYLQNVDYYNERQAMTDLYNDFRNSKWIQTSSVSSWYESYVTWLMNTKNGNQMLDSNNWPVSETLFYEWLHEYLDTVEGSKFTKDIIFDQTSTFRIITSRIIGNHVIFKNAREEVMGMDDVRQIALDANFMAEGEDAAFAYSKQYINFESNKVIQNELLRNLGLAGLIVLVVVYILLANLLQTLLVFCCVIFTLVDLSGSLNFWGNSIDVVASVFLILAVGLAVDYCVHIGHTFMIFSGTRDERVRATLGCMGGAVFNGGFSTFLAFILLAFSDSYIFITFFKVFFLVVLFGLFHGLVFLPVALSLIGPSAYESAKPADTVFANATSLEIPGGSYPAIEYYYDGWIPQMSNRENPVFVEDETQYSQVNTGGAFYIDQGNQPVPKKNFEESRHTDSSREYDIMQPMKLREYYQDYNPSYSNAIGYFTYRSRPPISQPRRHSSQFGRSVRYLPHEGVPDVTYSRGRTRRSGSMYLPHEGKQEVTYSRGRTRRSGSMYLPHEGKQEVTYSRGRTRRSGSLYLPHEGEQEVTYSHGQTRRSGSLPYVINRTFVLRTPQIL